jgi:hypothetical protein
MSVLRRQHDGQDARGDVWVGGVGGSKLQLLVVVVDFPEDGEIPILEAAEIVLIMRVVCLREMLEVSDRLENDQGRRRTQALDALGDQNLSALKACAEPVVEVTDDVRLLMSGRRASGFAAGHGIVPFLGGLAVGSGLKGLEQGDELALSVSVALDISLGCRDGPVSGQFLDIAQGTAGLGEQPGRRGYEGPAPRVGRAPHHV